MPTAVAIIPARYGSTRLPGKALADIKGKSLIRRVYEQVERASSLARVAVATDDERIVREVESFGGNVVMTSPDHKSGTDRVAEAAAVIGGDIIVNVQGDEPLIDPSVINAVIGKITADSGIVCSTAASPIRDEAEFLNPNAVKVVIDSRGHALYFSRSPIPFYRDSVFCGAFLHTGIYCFNRDFLMRYAGLEQTPLEKAEKLEQLRILENGYAIGVIVSAYRSMGVDTPEDLERVRAVIE